MQKRLYDSQRWREARRTFLGEHPLCRYCEQDGRSTPATVVDHIIPHKGDATLFWDVENWAPICAMHHSATKQREERTGRVVGCDANGEPIDPSHPWGVGR